MMCRIFFRVFLAITNVKVNVINRNNEAKSTIYISNHISYLDIFVIGASLETRFTPKSDIASWPIFGFLTNLSFPVYINRRAGKNIHHESAKIAEALDSGYNITIFPEGTSSNGEQVLPFKSSFFEVAGNFPITPIAIRYDKVNGENINHQNRDIVAWYGDMDFIPHLWNLLKAKSVECSLIIGSNLPPQSLNRKDLASMCYDEVTQNLNMDHVY